MKKIDLILPILAAALVVSCSTEKDEIAPQTKGNVTFNLRSAALQPGTDAASGTEGFRILVFKKNASDDYVYLRDIPLDSMRANGSTLSGSLQMPAGDYKFIPTHGLTSPGGYSWPEMNEAVLCDSLCIVHNTGTLPPVFMMNKPLSDIEPSLISLDGPPVTVNATLRRAVSRVDVLFVRADKNGNTYTPKKGTDVFGPEKLGKATLEFDNANSHLGLSGVKYTPAGAAPFHVSHTLESIPDALVMGTGETTSVGEDGYVNYDAVAPADVIEGSAFLRGTYLVPNTDDSETVGCVLHLVSGEGNERNIILDKKLPLKQNMVTLIRVYVLGDNVFSTGVDFAYEIDTKWDGVRTVDGEIE